ncbi:MAG: hypothetical protein H3C35_06170 [Bacteroidetes bacterium]|nr:hypothetical protein [Bacteroidota bacterium]
MPATKFSTFELLRIIIPGMYCTTIIVMFFYILNAELFNTISQNIFWLMFFAFSLVIGLTIYAKETPKKRKAFQTNLPSYFIAERSRSISNTPLTDEEAKKIYFYILNQHMPVTVQDKIFFFGMLYSIMVNIRRLSFWFGIIGIAAMVIQYGFVGYISPSLLWFIFILWIIYFLNVRYNKADRKMQENYQDQIFWLETNLPIIDTLLKQRSEFHS